MTEHRTIAELPKGIFPDMWGAFTYAETFLRSVKGASDEFDQYIHHGGIHKGQHWFRTFALDRLGGKFSNATYVVNIKRGADDGLYTVSGFIQSKTHNA